MATLTAYIPEPKAPVDTDIAWVQAASFETLLEHFALASVKNKYHNGELGKYFSQILDQKRSALTADQIADINARVQAQAKRDLSTLH